MDESKAQGVAVILFRNGKIMEVRCNAVKCKANMNGQLTELHFTEFLSGDFLYIRLDDVIGVQYKLSET